MSGAHEINFHGRFDSEFFGIVLSLDKIFDFTDNKEGYNLFFHSICGIDDNHRNFIKNIQNESDVLKFLNIFTTFEHEKRHWFDMTATPFGMYSTFQKLFSFFHFSISLEYIFSKNEIVYFPILKYINNYDFFQKNNYKNNIDSYLKEKINDGLKLLEKSNLVFGTKTEHDNTIITTVKILETLAVLTQLKVISHQFDFRCVKIFKQFLNSNKEKYLIHLLDNNNIKNIDYQIDILEATLYGNYTFLGSKTPSPDKILKEILIHKDAYITTERKFIRTSQSYDVIIKTLNHYKTFFNDNNYQNKNFYKSTICLIDYVILSIYYFSRKRFSYKFDNTSTVNFDPLILIEGFPGIEVDTLPFPYRSIINYKVNEEILKVFKNFNHPIEGNNIIHPLFSINVNKIHHNILDNFDNIFLMKNLFMEKPNSNPFIDLYLQTISKKINKTLRRI